MNSWNISKHHNRKTKKASLLATLAVCTTLLVHVPLASAGQPGVFVAADTYFTLDNAVFTAGSASSALQFTLKMHNGSSGSVDFNGYGVQVVDGQGNSFPAKLTSKQGARVDAGKDQSFSFIAQTAAGLSASDLKVRLFSWDSGAPSFMQTIGDLPVSTAVSGGLDPSKLMLLSMKDVDSSYSQDAFTAMRLGQSYKVTQNGTTYLYTDLYVRNTGSSNFQLPNSLLFRLKGSDSMTYSGALVSGSQETLLPNKLTKLKIRTAVPSNAEAESMTLEAYYSNSAEERVLGSVPLSGMTAAVPLGSEQPYSMYGTDNGLKLNAAKAIAVKQTDGTMIQTTVNVRNDGSAIVAIPELDAAYQIGDESLGAAVQDLSVASGYISPGQTATYTYSVVIPEGIDPNSVKLALMEASGSSGSGSGSGSSNTNNSSSSNNSNSSNSNSSGASGSSSNTTGSNTTANNGTAETGNTSSANKTSSTVNVSSYPVMMVELKGIQQSVSASQQASPYTLGSPFVLSSNGLIDKNLEISLVELHMHENADLGYKTAIGKYKITNRGSGTLAMPNIGTELVNGSGLSFAGVKQTTTATTIMPNTSYIVSYSYLLPTNETGASLALNVIDPKSAAPNKLTIGSYQVAVQNESSDKVISFYPFEVTFHAFSIATMYKSGYVYELNLDLEVNRKETVVVDQNFSKMEFELVDSLGRVLGSQSMAFTGTNKLITGSQKVTFSDIKTEQFDNNMVINVYETIETANGPAKRLVKQLTDKP